MKNIIKEIPQEILDKYSKKDLEIFNEHIMKLLTTLKTSVDEMSKADLDENLIASFHMNVAVNCIIPVILHIHIDEDAETGACSVCGILGSLSGAITQQLISINNDNQTDLINDILVIHTRNRDNDDVSNSIH